MLDDELLGANYRELEEQERERQRRSLQILTLEKAKRMRLKAEVDREMSRPLNPGGGLSPGEVAAIRARVRDAKHRSTWTGPGSPRFRAPCG